MSDINIDHHFRYWILAAVLAGLGFLLGRERAAPTPAAAPITARPAPIEYQPARSGALRTRRQAYAEVAPIADLPLRAGEAGVITGLQAIPGLQLRAGERLAQLSGPAISALIDQNQAAVSGARSQLAAAGKVLTIARNQLATHLATRQSVQADLSAMAQAQAALQNALVQQRSTIALASITAPAAGTVIAVQAAAGERVAAGDPVLTLRLSGQLWLTASFYGPAAALHNGELGQFQPSNSQVSIPVRVAAVLGALTPGGAEAVLLRADEPAPRAPPPWLGGEFGTVTFTAAPQPLVEVPTRSLILDGGRWWVLVRTPAGPSPQAVVPGPSRGWFTFLLSGLAPGTPVVVSNAYLLYHNAIAQSYLLPD